MLDTGPLFAAHDRRDPDHERSRILLETSRERLVIPAPVANEATHFMTTRLAPEVLTEFLRDIAAGDYLVQDLLPEDYARAADICEQYADARIGFVDAAVLTVVERLGERKLATLDHRHFGLLRPRHVDALELLPAL
ncbi:MAG: PIN domain-containing protein [Chloroflexi bacterium]|nr:PIN domain-containing protein [Chloroflexota bacterium]